ncbi:ABC transporter substrate-binding protein [Pelagibius sp. 7325]|uniref:ABC transporter substrate-binding protein n=1 Tax=Pelagibius sp. 7325 TaxID=3131994 RepID=UPI0030ECD4EF
MKKLISAVFVAALAFGAALNATGADAKEWKKVRIGVEGAYPPFSEVTADGKLVGFDIDIANALCEEMKVECELITQDWDGIIPALQARKYDAIIASMSITPERKEKVDFTNKYYNTPAKFVRKKGSGIEITKEGMKGKVVGVQRATIHDNFVTEVYGDTVEVKRYATQDEAYLDMVAGRVDLLLADSVAMDGGFIQTDAGKDFEFVGPDFSDPQYFGEGAGIALRKGEEDLREMFNNAIEAIRANGTYDTIQKKYFDYDVYGS